MCKSSSENAECGKALVVFGKVHQCLEERLNIRSALKTCKFLYLLKLLFFSCGDVNISAGFALDVSDLTTRRDPLFEKIQDAVIDVVQLSSEFV